MGITALIKGAVAMGITALIKGAGAMDYCTN